MVTTHRASAKEIFGWAMFDFANQAYTLLIITVVYGDLFTRVIVADGPDYRTGNLLWSVALAISYLMAALANPVCGAVMDHRGWRKRFLFASYVLTIAATALLWIVQPGWIATAMVLVILSNFAYAIGEAFIAGFLPGLGPRKDLGWISGLGWGTGYIGGLVSTAIALAFLGEVSVGNYERIRWVGPLAGAFFLVAAIPTFVWLREPGARRADAVNLNPVRAGFHRLRETFRNLGHFRDLRNLLVSVFFLMGGIYIIISFSFIYGAQVIGWDERVRVMMFVTVQITAAVGALGFGLIQGRIGARRTYLITLGLWMAAILAIWQTPGLTRVVLVLFGVNWDAQHVFLFAGSLAGLSLGSSQSAGRALVGVLTPPDKASEFFGFWGAASKLAAVFGILGLGLLQAWLGLELAILFCFFLFVAALLTVLPVNEARGAAAADAWREP